MDYTNLTQIVNKQETLVQKLQAQVEKSLSGQNVNQTVLTDSSEALEKAIGRLQSLYVLQQSVERRA